MAGADGKDSNGNVAGTEKLPVSIDNVGRVAVRNTTNVDGYSSLHTRYQNGAVQSYKSVKYDVEQVAFTDDVNSGNADLMTASPSYN